uniref:Uncharacterized protein n=1 Tax=Physcomitrium patens TaxID=3218 RepID=A0A2K1JZ66_PHYPA|nr:hypothetical protein PHYPA_013938 [Physcomitrium patens]
MIHESTPWLKSDTHCAASAASALRNATPRKPRSHNHNNPSKHSASKQQQQQQLALHCIQLRPTPAILKEKKLIQHSRFLGVQKSTKDGSNSVLVKGDVVEEEDDEFSKKGSCLVDSVVGNTWLGTHKTFLRSCEINRRKRKRK